MKTACQARLTSSVKSVKAAPVAKANRMMVWRPDNNKCVPIPLHWAQCRCSGGPHAHIHHCCCCRMFETFSYLPPLSDDQIARQVDYIVNNGWTPCLEFSEPELAYVGSSSCSRMGAVSSVSTLFLAKMHPIAQRPAPILHQQPGLGVSMIALAVLSYAALPPVSRRTTMTTGTGQCGSCPCSAAPIPCRCDRSSPRLHRAQQPFPSRNWQVAWGWVHSAALAPLGVLSSSQVAAASCTLTPSEAACSNSRQTAMGQQS